MRSSKRDFAHRSIFHSCCTLLQLCMLQKFEFYPNCRMRKCESVFIKTLRPSWSYSSIGPCSNILICKKNYVYNVHSCCTFRLAILLKDRSLDYFAHKFGLGLSTQRVTCNFPRWEPHLRTFFPPCKIFSTKFLHTRLSAGVLLCLKTGSWKEMNTG